MKDLMAVCFASLPFTQAMAAEAGHFDLRCKPKSGMMIVNGETKKLTSMEAIRVSVDLPKKLWCARADDNSCGTVSNLTETAAVIELNENVSVNRLSGIMTSNGQMGPITFLREYICIRQMFTPLPATKF